MKDNALRYRRIFPEETKGYSLEELAAISNLTGREGGNEYFLSIRNKTPFELPGINKTPEEYINTYRSAFEKKKRGGYRSKFW